jgi:hypothetical protein
LRLAVAMERQSGDVQVPPVAALIGELCKGVYALRIELGRIDQEQRNRIDSVRVFVNP